MRRTLSALGLGVTLVTVGLTVPTATVQADTRCNQEWNAVPGDHRDGRVRIWRDAYCTNRLDDALGDDYDWGDGGGEITNATNTVSSVMNNGDIGGYDVVAFYDYTGYDWRYGYTCLKPGQFYADNLADDKFRARTAGSNAGTAYSANDAISSHKWVTAQDCDTFLDKGK
ncbi:hypothetical protein HII36_31220 [Nonomuraea sp. NN258]|uniref:hypothetical protein n=1 Tax=Nonomuraea antri TaxID=2730852 RepID=UPI001567DB98|nr:hypothetical protein [Nonomuraea antri]NRQ36272.1 hypothetical protein [Nonomuraea antri]